MHDARDIQRQGTELEMRSSDLAARDVYHLLTSLVIPRPIAWVSTYGPDGVRNVAPHSYFRRP